MGMLDGILGQVAGNPAITNLAEKVGLSPEQVSAAIGALGAAHGQEGDTVAAAADSTGLPHDVLNQILAHVGGEGALGDIGRVLGGGEGGIGGMLGGLFGKD
ncbi:winged helix-turn-helix domain-containing protein [Sphingomonas beigongshangi]|uniref:winged helix-turn-helix domain-containing protein n=1 Tax=Sphingomonas beigongshangi TaxID=2782540 RepID=UPI00193C57C5|nr:winged helix-turn-helix domain-containing protein [Sphingomonas beigongshangi]